MEDMAFLSLELNKRMENRIYWSFCSYRENWGSEISVKFSILDAESSLGNQRITEFHSVDGCRFM